MEFNIPEHLVGLNETELNQSREKHGYNEMFTGERSTWYKLLMAIFKEPMLLLLIAVSIIYVIVGDYGEALFMLGAIIAVSAISFYQDNRSDKALEELEKLNEPLSTVIRQAKVLEIPTHEIAVGDLCIVVEGKMINADGEIVHSNDFSVNEASLTGETYSIFKSVETEDKNVYSGTVVMSGLAVFEVQKIGKSTQIGQIGESIREIEKESSPLQHQINHFVKVMAVIGIVIFLAVCFYSYYKTGNWIDSLLVGLTLAMSILPEEIPVAFTTFMALGAWKLMREGIIIKRSNIVETLGSTTVICADKTGTITKNAMDLKFLYDFKSNRVYAENEFDNEHLNKLIDYAMWASEPVPFNPMEQSIHRIYEATQAIDQRRDYNMIHEYPLDGVPPMMTHIFEDQDQNRIIAAKGAPEAIIDVCQLSPEEKAMVKNQISNFAKDGYRMLGVAKAAYNDSHFPENQQDFNFKFLGITVFFDPPKDNINEVFQKVYDAGIKLKVITGDNKETTASIAEKAGIINHHAIIEGAEIAEIEEEELGEIAQKYTLFTRMFPKAKLRIVNALKKEGEIVAMVGDGVNDAPALQAAHIGVAMGSKGTEMAKAAASLIITNDDLDKLIVGIAAGRRIYTNLKKAIQYVISIHIPIILTVALPLFFGWVYPEIFTPVHVIFLELIMGPICSIVYENEPMEKNTMIMKPRKMTDTFLSGKELGISVIQGLVIGLGVLISYQWAVSNGANEEKTRAMVFTTLILANIFLSLANRSFYYSIWETLKNKNNLLYWITILTILLLASILYIPSVSSFFKLESLSLFELTYSLLFAAVSVLWVEIYKFWKRRKLV